jgi:tRNA threonylcarbamoyl adenosine modification protein YjeE
MAFEDTIPVEGMRRVWNARAREEEIDGIASRLAPEFTRRLREGERFVCWLLADMGGGKTTLTGALLRAMGHPAHVPVLSPTFTYLNEYRLENQWVAHIDFYRASAGFDLEELGLIDARDYRGYFIEWPLRVDAPAAIRPTCLVRILWVDAESREFELWEPDRTSP